jgi:hypothetical protein
MICSWSSCKGNGHNGHDENDGCCPNKNSNAVYNERHNGILFVNAEDRFHRCFFVLKQINQPGSEQETKRKKSLKITE